MGSGKAVAAFRAYAWDADIAALAARFFAACPGARPVVLADETRGPLGITGYEVVSHTDDTADLGVPRIPPDRSLWYNVDYAWYYLRRHLPDHDVYVASESDVAVNLDVGPMVAHVRRHGIGLMAHGIAPATPDWDWHANSRLVYGAPWRSLLCFSIVSGTAIDVLLAERRRLARAATEAKEGEPKAWPFCEAFVPTTLHAAGLTFAEVGTFADTSRYAYRPRYAADDPASARPGSLVHSVLGRRAFVASLLREHDLRQYFVPGTYLHAALRDYPLPEYGGAMLAELARRRHFAEYQTFARTMRAAGLAGPDRRDGSGDAARLKPALVSSVSRWSRSQDPRIEACGLNGPDLPEDFGCHTGQEDGPWWLVDLMAVHAVEAVHILNRAAHPERFVNFLIEGSLDGAHWALRHVKITPEPISCDANHPHRIGFAAPFRARFVRVRLIGPGILHLRRVEVHGRPASAA